MLLIDFLQELLPYLLSWNPSVGSWWCHGAIRNAYLHKSANPATKPFRPRRLKGVLINVQTFMHSFF